MQAVKSTGSEIERMLARGLWNVGLRYRKNDRRVLGTPDFTLRRLKIAVFADSEFWHGKNWRVRKHDHRTNIDFWHQKIEANINRDRKVNRSLRNEGWIVIRFWGADIRNKLDSCVNIVYQAVESRKSVAQTRRASTKSGDRKSEP
jgi:DNA mismatch endonuclease, patch repair protein